MNEERVRADAVYRDGARPRQERLAGIGRRSPGGGRGSGAGGRGRGPAGGPVQAQSPFRRLARTHAFMSMGDAAMYGALAGSVLFSLPPDAQRDKVLLYLLVSVAPFAVVAPAIGPTVDRIPGGRRMVMQITSVARALLYMMMAFHVDDLLLYPLIFGAMVMSKTYAVSKSALVPSVVRSEEELVEANSKLSLISGVMGALAIGPLAGVGKLSPGVALFAGSGLFIAATLAARQLPKDVVASAPAEREEKVELRSAGIVLATGAMALIRASVGFLTFHLFFWLREDFGLVQFGLALGAGTVGSMSGNLLAPALRRSIREELMLTIALAVIAGAGVAAAITGGLVTAILLAFVVNFSSAIGRLAFDSLVQRDAPDANQGRAFAKFETRFQLAWVLAGLPPVFFTLPGQVGFLVVGLIGAFAGASFFIGSKAVRSGKPVPMTLTARARRGLAANVAKRRGNTPAGGTARPSGAAAGPSGGSSGGPRGGPRGGTRGSSRGGSRRPSPPPHVPPPPPHPPSATRRPPPPPPPGGHHERRP
ncbi:MAG: MFS transporter [Actinomycetota bacterium]|nr:MFS transporter [Actinomycetota bacterium]